MNPRLPIGIMFGRLIRVRAHRHDPEATIYVVAEPEVEKGPVLFGQPRDRTKHFGTRDFSRESCVAPTRPV